MNRQTYEEIKKQIQNNFHEEMAHLEALAPRFGVFNTKQSLSGHKTILKQLQKPEMKVLKEIPANGVLMRIDANALKSKYVNKLLSCEVKDCIRKTNPNNKCPSCTKRVCTRHLRGKVCHECNQRGEN